MTPKPQTIDEIVVLFREELEPISFMVEDKYSETIVIDYYKAKSFLHKALTSRDEYLREVLEKRKVKHTSKCMTNTYTHKSHCNCHAVEVNQTIDDILLALKEDLTTNN